MPVHTSWRNISRKDYNSMESIIDRLTEFVENEARSCSMDFGCVMPEYVYRMWGGCVAIDVIEAAMRYMNHS